MMQELLTTYQFSEADLWKEDQASRTDGLQSWPWGPHENDRCLDGFSNITECTD